jgi:hypothetical protein
MQARKNRALDNQMQNIEGIDGTSVSLGVENYDENLET